MPLLAPVIATTVGVSISVMTPTLPGDCQGTLPRVVAVTAPTRSRSAVLRTVLLDVAPPLVGYYGLRACGASDTSRCYRTVLSDLRWSHERVKAHRPRRGRSPAPMSSGERPTFCSRRCGVGACSSRSPFDWRSSRGYRSTSRTVCCPPSHGGRSACSAPRQSWSGGDSGRAGNKGEPLKVERIRLNFGGLNG